MDTKTLSDRIGEKYAWPGGYPMYLVMMDGEAVCMNCAAKNEELILRATNDGYEKDWIAVAIDVNWEDPDLLCTNCNERIESAYGEENPDAI
jgi:hypothetical protein